MVGSDSAGSTARPVVANHVTTVLDAPMKAGVVESFDTRVGWGQITDEDGISVGFHAIEIADGSRDIAVGTPVVFVEYRRFGATQAVGVRAR